MRSLRWIAASLALTCAAAHAAEAFAPAGARATLSVDYIYESSGKKSSSGMYDPYEWRVKRTANLVATLAAQPATEMPTVQAIDASQMAGLKGKGDKAQAISTQMAPMMADAQKIMAKCGEDEACISREAMAMGAAMQANGQMDTAMKAKKDAQALMPGAPRYQAWRATAGKGTYLIDETVHVSVPDPICASKPRHRCTRDEVRKGSGDVVVAPIAAAELDAQKNTLTLAFPIPSAPSTYTETIVTDEPEGTHDTPTPKGPRQKQLFLRVTAREGMSPDKPLTIPLKGGWRSQSGEQVVKLNGELREAGTLTVRWRFAVQ